MGREKILIVDDDQDLLIALNIRLKANGYRVVTATDAITAVSVARKEEPDLIILDIGLPGGDAFIVMERLVSLMSVAVPIIILTARDPLINKERALSTGAVAFLQKPADNDELLAVIREALGEPGQHVQEGA
ncbi:MAG: response regulator transcription factor [Candidatus Binatia bacterium]